MRALFISTLAALLTGTNLVQAQVIKLPNPNHVSLGYSPSPGSHYRVNYQSGPHGSVASSGITPSGVQYGGSISHAVGGFHYSNPEGLDVGGKYTYHDSKNYSVSGHYYTPSVGYGGHLGRQNGAVLVGGDMREPISVDGVPVAQGRIGADARLSGRASSLDARAGLYDPTGKYRLGSAAAHLDRHSLSGSSSDGYSGQLHFAGIHSTASAEKVTGVSGANYRYGASIKHGVSVHAGVQLGGVKVGAQVGADGHGVHVKTTTPNLRVPASVTSHVPSSVSVGGHHFHL